MIRKQLYILILVMILGTFSSCKKTFLEVVPLGLQVAATTNDYDRLMNDPVFYLARNSGGWQEEVLMGDEICADDVQFSAVSPQMNRLFKYQDQIYFQTDLYQQLPWFTSALLTSAYQVNKIINEVMASTGGTDAQKKSILAEAKATRAWGNFQLINLYAKPYLASTADKDPGFPIITEANVAATKFNRGTVQEMYDFIIKDLTEAITDLPLKPLVRTRMSKAAAEGILGKVYLFMGRSKDALPLLNAAFNDLGNDGAKLYDYNVTLATGGSFLPIDATTGPINGPGNNNTDMTESVLFKVFANGRFSGSMYGNNGLQLTPETTALYDSTDLRLKLYSNKNYSGSAASGGRLRKYGVKNSRFGLELSELYLLRAECKARLNDLPGAVADAEALRNRRMPAANAPVPAAIAGNQTALVKFIIDERIREFALEGYRWFDMRRLSVDPLFAGITFKHTLYKADGSTEVFTLRQPDRLTLQFPYNFMQYNPGMINNP